jgi:hypothetical protein
MRDYRPAVEFAYFCQKLIEMQCVVLKLIAEEAEQLPAAPGKDRVLEASQEQAGVERRQLTVFRFGNIKNDVLVQL